MQNYAHGSLLDQHARCIRHSNEENGYYVKPHKFYANRGGHPCNRMTLTKPPPNEFRHVSTGYFRMKLRSFIVPNHRNLGLLGCDSRLGRALLDLWRLCQFARLSCRYRKNHMRTLRKGIGGSNLHWSVLKCQRIRGWKRKWKPQRCPTCRLYTHLTLSVIETLRQQTPTYHLHLPSFCHSLHGTVIVGV